MEHLLLYSAFAAASLAFGITVAVRQKGSVASRLIVAFIATFAAFVFFYKIVMPVVGYWSS